MSGKWDMMHPRFGQDLGGRCQILWQNPELGCLHSKSCSINCPCHSSNWSNQSWSSLIVYLSLFLLTIQSYSKRRIKYLVCSIPDKRITKKCGKISQARYFALWSINYSFYDERSGNVSTELAEVLQSSPKSQHMARERRGGRIRLMYITQQLCHSTPGSKTQREPSDVINTNLREHIKKFTSKKSPSWHRPLSDSLLLHVDI